MTNERRYDKRVNVEIEVSLEQINGAVVNAKSHDIGMSGVLVETPRINIEPGTRVELGFCVNDFGSEQIFKLSGSIVRNTEIGVAIRFDEMDHDAFVALQRIVDQPEVEEPPTDEHFGKGASEIQIEQRVLH